MKIGECLGERYIIKKCIGQGGMSSVYLASDIKLGKDWALKVVKKNGCEQGVAFEVEASAEARLLKKMDHPALPHIIDIIETDNQFIVVMDYIEGITLEQYLNQNKRVDEETAVSWAREICDVLDYLHKQTPPVIYRDMKPGNVMLTRDGKIKVIDLGIAREYKKTVRQDTVCLGTRGYAAPEQYGGSGQSDERTDVYCLGVTLYHLVTGKDPSKPPYELLPIRKVDASLSSGLEMVIIKSTQSNPEDRYQTAYEFCNALNKYKTLGKNYYRKKKMLIRRFRVLLLLSFFMMMLGKWAKDKSIYYYENEYNQVKHLAEISEGEEKIDCLMQAIKLRADEKENYCLLLDELVIDGEFDDAEQKLVGKVMLYSKDDMDGIDAIYSRIGKLYWYFCKEDEMAGKLGAIPWFTKAVNAGATEGREEVYLAMGSFYKNIALRIKEADDRGMYIEYIESLEKVAEEMEIESSDYIKLEALGTGMNSVYQYLPGIKKDGVSGKRILHLVEKMGNGLKDIKANTNEDRQLIKDYLRLTSDTKKAIIQAYKEEMS